MGFRQGLMSWEKASKQKDYAQLLLVRHNWLEKMFSEAIIVDYKRHKQYFVPYFKGSEREMSWMTSSPLLDVPGHIRPVSLKWEKTPSGYSLYYRQADLHNDPGRIMNWSQPWVELIKSLEKWEFSYEAPSLFLMGGLDRDLDLSPLDRKRYRDKAEWLMDYDSFNLLRAPLRIKMSFVDVKKQRHEWYFSLPNTMDTLNLYNFYDE